MEIRKILYRKEMKLVTLLLTSLLIASASATVYYSLVMQSTVTTQAPEVKFEAGNDSTAAGATGGDLTDAWVRMGSLKAYPNASLTYDQAVNISCTGANHQIKLTHSSITDGTSAVSNFTSIKFELIAANGSQVGTDFTYSNANGDNDWDSTPSMNYITILEDEEWSVKVTTKAVAGAAADAVVAIVINLDVQ
jgi:hypothetical protein